MDLLTGYTSSDGGGDERSPPGSPRPVKRLRLAGGYVLPPEPARVRAFPHVDGNWPTVTYIAVPDDCTCALAALAARLLRDCPAASCLKSPAQPGEQAGPLHLWPTFPASLLRGDGSDAPTSGSGGGAAQALQAQEAAAEGQLPLHVSVSRTVAIRYLQHASLKAALAKQLAPFRAFTVQLRGLQALVNDSASRSFVGLRVAPAGERQVVRLVQAVNRAFAAHGLPPYYETPQPHVSLAWTPGDVAEQLQPWLDAQQHEAISMRVAAIVCQIGKTAEVVWRGD